MFRQYRRVYLGTPYSNYAGGVEQAFYDACNLAARLVRCGVRVYSPIAHTHPIAVHGGLDLYDLSLWLPFDEAIMEVCDAMLVGQLPGWDKSKGVKHEIDYFTLAGKPVYDLNPMTLEATLRA